jgi:hypothetical protein
VLASRKTALGALVGGRTDAGQTCVLAALLVAGGAMDALAQKASDEDPREGEYERLVFNALGQDCPPGVGKKVYVMVVTDRRIDMSIDNEFGFGTYDPVKREFLINFNDFYDARTVVVSGSFQEPWEGRITIDLNLRWPAGTDCAASATASLPVYGSPPAPPPTVIGPANATPPSPLLPGTSDTTQRSSPLTRHWRSILGGVVLGVAGGFLVPRRRRKV